MAADPYQTLGLSRTATAAAIKKGYRLATQGSLPKVMIHLNARTDTLLLATAIGVAAILPLALAVPLTGLADLNARFSLVFFAFVQITLIRIKSLETTPLARALACPWRVHFAGLRLKHRVAPAGLGDALNR